MKKEILKGISKVVLQSAKKNVNSACAVYIYQPKAPEASRKLRKF
ncbi:MAG: cyclic lactone autoinducer peptide [Lachnospiraceae bacterium]|nr:cyclic lactone autoinducer peptide [Lachnospiraceae bacterium]